MENFKNFIVSSPPEVNVQNNPELPIDNSVFDYIRFNIPNIAQMNIPLFLDEAIEVEEVANAIGIVDNYVTEQIATLLAENTNWIEFFENENINPELINPNLYINLLDLIRNSGLQKIRFQCEYPPSTLNFLIQSCRKALEEGGEREWVELRNLETIKKQFDQIKESNLPNQAIVEISPPIYKDHKKYMIRIYTFDSLENKIKLDIYHVPSTEIEILTFLNTLNVGSNEKIETCQGVQSYPNRVLSTLYLVDKNKFNLENFIPFINQYSSEIIDVHDHIVDYFISEIIERPEIKMLRRQLAFTALRLRKSVINSDRIEYTKLFQQYREIYNKLITLCFVLTPNLTVEGREATLEERNRIAHNVAIGNVTSEKYSIHAPGPCTTISLGGKQRNEVNTSIKTYSTVFGEVKIDHETNKITCVCGTTYLLNFDCEEDKFISACPSCGLSTENIYKSYNHEKNQNNSSLLDLLLEMFGFKPIEQ
ncbi:MAG: hypothetical protein KatS3mg085_155 [Candidatus Dojkabacteria bacterium]|nr:MAG: hypothetical protein KatS3mg085_155 [Candidatus Dojkabacteria bacterium]GIW58842.1 MAG: hypothetical protein KatS3mg086_127 [Candidatus Dojkabacteria bacterium]